MTRFIILAAGEGTRLRPLTQDQPKCMIEVQGKSLLDWQIENARKAGIQEIVVVKGYLQEKIDCPGIRLYINEEYSTTNMVETLWCAQEEFEDKIIISYGDILYEQDVLQTLLNSEHEISVVVDKQWRPYWEKRFENSLNDAESLRVDQTGRILNIGQKVDDICEIQGQYIGLLKFQGEGINSLISVYQTGKRSAELGELPFGCNRPFSKLYMTDLLQGIIDSGHDIFEIPINRKWLEIDSLSDYDLANKICKVSNGSLIITE